MTTPRILLSNDDGFHAAGLVALREALQSFADVWIVAPDRERSATSHAISLHKPLRVRATSAKEFLVDGTPTDCIYLALHHLMASPPDVVLSGINHGANLGNDVIYSGTVSAAMEGALYGHNAIAVSLCLPPSHGDPQQSVVRHFDAAAQVAAALVRSVLLRPLPPGVLLNVNVPNVPREQIRGIKLCRLGYTDWADAVTKRADPRGRPYYWIGGERRGHDAISDSDNNAVSQGYVALTPIHYDVTDYRSFAHVRRLALDGFQQVSDNLGDEALPHPVHPKARGRTLGGAGVG